MMHLKDESDSSMQPLLKKYLPPDACFSLEAVAADYYEASTAYG